MSTSVYYKGAKLVDVSNNTKTLLTSGKYLEDDVTLTDNTLVPSGTSTITSNGIYDIKNYASVSVSVSNSGGSYYSAYRDLIVDLSLRASNSYVEEWFNSLSSINSTLFYGAKLYGSGASSIISFPNVSHVGNYAFAFDTLNSSVNPINSVTFNFPECTYIGSSCFRTNNAIKAISAPKCTEIRADAFYLCYSLVSVYAPKCEALYGSTFYGCSSLSTIDLPSCSSIGISGFYNCSNLRTVNLPLVSSIPSYAFSGCTALNSISSPAAQRIGTSAFDGCSALAEAIFPSCTSIASNAFISCWALSIASFAMCSIVHQSAFAYCSGLTDIYFPSCSVISSYAFAVCKSLTTASFPRVASIGNWAFTNCSNLRSLYLDVSAVPTLGSSVFYQTPITVWSTAIQGYGSIYVPSSLYTSFITATNWSAIYSRIVSV